MTVTSAMLLSLLSTAVMVGAAWGNLRATIQSLAKQVENMETDIKHLSIDNARLDERTARE